jgi:Protein of unknown function (DUF3810)
MIVIRLTVVALAVAAALLPLPAALVERVFSQGFYPWIQAGLTRFSNSVPFALFDVLLAAGLLVLANISTRAISRWRRAERVKALVVAGQRLVTWAAVLYLAFLLLWGLNYRRVPLREKLDFRADRANLAALRALNERAVSELNALYGPAHRAGFVGWRELPTELGGAFALTERELGSRFPAVPGVPKWSVLTFYFERAGVEGMTDPFFLEVLVNRSLLPFERPFVVAHEWAHLAGHADEAEANFVGWLTCLHGGPPARYSAWLSISGSLLSALPSDERAAIAKKLGEGPRRDLQEVRRRVAREWHVVRRASWRIYDRYLRANRVEAGVASYDQVTLLILGTRFEDGWVPVRAAGSTGR